MSIQKKRFVFILLLVVLILLVPFLAMQLSSEVNWSANDFIVAGVLLTGAGFLVDFVLRKIKNKNYRIAAVIAVVLLLLMVWAELAVGIFGTPFAGS
jgi:hypothetical protein